MAVSTRSDKIVCGLQGGSRLTAYHPTYPIDMDRCISFFMDLTRDPSPLIPLPALFTGFAFTGAGRGQGEGGMNFCKEQ